MSNKNKPANLSGSVLDTLMSKHQSTVDKQTQGQLMALRDWLVSHYSMSNEEAHKFSIQHQSELLPCLAGDQRKLKMVVNSILTR